jgi:ribosome-associated toxin RatA of RatAB toxin-antitoxin module
MIRTLPFALVLFASFAFPVDDSQAQTPTIETTTESSGNGVDYGIATVVVDAPVDDVMGVITDYANYATFMPNFERSRVLSRRGQNALVYVQASALRGSLTVWAQMRIYARRPQGETRIIEGRMTDGNLEQFTARWEVTPIDERRTEVRFRILFVPDLPFPDSVVTTENVRAARRTLQGLQRRLDAV